MMFVRPQCSLTQLAYHVNGFWRGPMTRFGAGSAGQVVQNPVVLDSAVPRYHQCRRVFEPRDSALLAQTLGRLGRSSFSNPNPRPHPLIFLYSTSRELGQSSITALNWRSLAPLIIMGLEGS